MRIRLKNKTTALHNIFCLVIAITITFISVCRSTPVYGSEPPSRLYAKYSALIDASNGRVLFEKNGYEKAANASTTKIMTCLLALELGAPEDIVTVSAYAASMPDVQLNITKGEQYHLIDLLYSLMLQSHNDSAVTIAEYIAEKYLSSGKVYTEAAKRTQEESLELVRIFADAMNLRAKSLGCNDTHFITPNGLDASDDEGFHSTTAVDLARIMAECIRNETFLKIAGTQSHSFTNVSGRTTRSVHNTNAFLNMMDGVIAGKTGFTGDAGYCYVCAFERDGRKFVSVVLACGWPNNKTYKWKDTRKLLEYANSSYFNTEVFTPVDNYRDVSVSNGITSSISTYIPDSLVLLTSENDVINTTYDLPECIDAPIAAGDIVGKVNIFINDTLYTQLPIYSKTSVSRIDFLYCLRNAVNTFTLQIN